MSREPAFGEVWLSPDGTVLPGGMLCLVVSGDLYNAQRAQRIVVEVISQRLPSAGGVLVDLGPIGSAVVDTPIAVSLNWFAGSTEPVAIVDPGQARRAADALRALLGP